MAAYFLRFRLNYKTSSVIPESDGYAPFEHHGEDPKHPYHWTVVCDVRGRVVVRERDHVLATGTWQSDWDVVDPVTRTPDVPTTEQWVFIAEHLRAMIEAPACKQHPASPDMIDDGSVEEARPAPHPHAPRSPRPAEAAPSPLTTAPTPKNFGVVGTILGTIALVLIVAGVIVYFAVLKPTITHPNRRLGETCTIDLQCSSGHCHHLTCVAH